VNAKQLTIVSAVVGVVLVAIIVLLVTGSAPPGENFRDGSGDVEIGDGDSPPSDISLADIREAKVHQVASQIVFEATMGAEISPNLKGETMAWRWELSEGGDFTWLVTANVSVGRPIAAVTAQRTDYGTSTVDGRLPGTIDYDGDTIFIRLDHPEIPDFPSAFTWNLKTTLDGDRADPASATATDEAPESGLGEYPPPE